MDLPATAEEVERWLTAPAAEGLRLQRPLADWSVADRGAGSEGGWHGDGLRYWPLSLPRGMDRLLIQLHSRLLCDVLGRGKAMDAERRRYRGPKRRGGS